LVADHVGAALSLHMYGPAAVLHGHGAALGVAADSTIHAGAGGAGVPLPGLPVGELGLLQLDGVSAGGTLVANTVKQHLNLDLPDTFQFNMIV